MEYLFKETYETPSMHVVEVNVDEHLLQASVNGERKSYGDAIDDEW